MKRKQLIEKWAQRRKNIIVACRGNNMASVGRKFGISRQRVRQIISGKMQ